MSILFGRGRAVECRSEIWNGDIEMNIAAMGVRTSDRYIYDAMPILYMQLMAVNSSQPH